MSEKPGLLLLPNLLGEHLHADLFLPASVGRAVATVDGLIAESEAGGRRFLGRFETKKKASEIPIALYKGETDGKVLDFLLEPIIKGERWGLVSDAGLPCIADPGAYLVRRARERGIAVQAFIGPSSIFLGLMLSGLPGQKFSFLGYAERSPANREKQLHQLSHIAKKEGVTQIMMEAPHRNSYLLDALVKTLPEEVWLSVVWDLTLPSQGVVTQRISSWKQATPPQLEKKPALFLFAY